MAGGGNRDTGLGTPRDGLKMEKRSGSGIRAPVSSFPSPLLLSGVRQATPPLWAWSPCQSPCHDRAGLCASWDSSGSEGVPESHAVSKPIPSEHLAWPEEGVNCYQPLCVLAGGPWLGAPAQGPPLGGSRSWGGRKS